VELHVQYKDGTSRSKWQCELSATDASLTGRSFVDVDGLTDSELKGVRSGASSLFVPGAAVSNGRLNMPVGVDKVFGTVDDQSTFRSSVQSENLVRARSLSAGIVDKRKVLVVRVLTPDAAPTSNLNQIRNFVFGTNGDISNLKERFNSCSYGETLMEPFNGTTTTNKRVTMGAYQMNITQKAKGVNDDTVVEAAKARLTALLGDLPSQFNHVMLCLPAGTLDDGTANWAAYGKRNTQE
jgi:hypothetical protein